VRRRPAVEKSSDVRVSAATLHVDPNLLLASVLAAASKVFFEKRRLALFLPEEGALAWKKKSVFHVGVIRQKKLPSRGSEAGQKYRIQIV